MATLVKVRNKFQDVVQDVVGDLVQLFTRILIKMTSMLFWFIAHFDLLHSLTLQGVEDHRIKEVCKSVKEILDDVRLEYDFEHSYG